MGAVQFRDRTLGLSNVRAKCPVSELGATISVALIGIKYSDIQQDVCKGIKFNGMLDGIYGGSPIQRQDTWSEQRECQVSCL